MHFMYVCVCRESFGMHSRDVHFTEIGRRNSAKKKIVLHFKNVKFCFCTPSHQAFSRSLGLYTISPAHPTQFDHNFVPSVVVFTFVLGKWISLSISPVPGSGNETAGRVTATKRAGSVDEAFIHLCIVPR